MEHREHSILVAGIGGVGGTVAANLVRTYGPAVTLMARGPRKKTLEAEGLVMHGDYFGDFTVQPALVTAEPGEAGIGVQDVIFLCVKNPGLEAVLRQLAPVVGEKTILVPVMNGITAGDVILRTLGKGRLVEATIFTVSMLAQDGSIRQKGMFTKLKAGSRPSFGEEGQEAARRAAALLAGAGMDVELVSDVRVSVWEKFIFNCSYNVATARWGTNVGGLAAGGHQADCRALMEEAVRVAATRGIYVPATLVDSEMARLFQKTRADNDSSLSRDFAAGRRGELETFSGDLVRLAESLHVAVPVTRAYYKALQEIASRFPEA